MDSRLWDELYRAVRRADTERNDSDCSDLTNRQDAKVAKERIARRQFPDLAAAAV